MTKREEQDRVIAPDCFAFHFDKNGNAACKALTKIECECCSFFKTNEEIKNNIFYKWSFKNEDEWRKAVNAMPDKTQILIREENRRCKKNQNTTIQEAKTKV